MAVYSEPKQVCTECGRSVLVLPGRGFPPDTAKKQLKTMCNANGCPSKPKYSAGLGLMGPVTGQEQ